eukprot:Colp12_sorted_trinity150504_noHs@11385
MEEGSLDVITMIFVLSAIHPSQFAATIARLAKLLRPGGRLLLRDYGRYDLAQLRFKKGHLLSDNFYVRGDGTQVYFFTREEMGGLCSSAGLVEESCDYDKRLIVNRARKVTMYRNWLQSRYLKPLV